MKLVDVQTAARLRDIMRRVAKKEIDRAHPPDIFGHVSDIDELAGTVKITVEGSSEETSASYGFGDPPAIGEAVRVTGRSGSRYVVGTGTGTVTPIEEQVVDDGVAISGLDPATLPLTGDELVIVVQDGVTKRATTQDIADLATGGGSGFPVGPYDDGTATYEISEPSPLPTAGASAMVFSGLSDANGAEVDLSLGFLGSGIATGASLNGSTQDGSEAHVLLSVVDATSTTVTLEAQAAGGGSAVFEVGSLASGGGSLFGQADHVEFWADEHVLLQAPAIQFAGATATPIVPVSCFAFWLDDTPGATVLNIKAEDSGGTVRTASIALT